MYFAIYRFSQFIWCFLQSYCDHLQAIANFSDPCERKRQVMWVSNFCQFHQNSCKFVWLMWRQSSALMTAVGGETSQMRCFDTGRLGMVVTLDYSSHWGILPEPETRCILRVEVFARSPLFSTEKSWQVCSPQQRQVPDETRCFVYFFMFLLKWRSKIPLLTGGRWGSDFLWCLAVKYLLSKILNFMGLLFTSSLTGVSRLFLWISMSAPLGSRLLAFSSSQCRTHKESR